MKKLRAIFFGTPQLSADILAYLLNSEGLNIVAIVSNPDAAGGRGHALIPSPVTLLAKERNITLLQPEKVKNNPLFLEAIKTLKPDICLVVAYGKILPQELIDISPMGFLNVHTSLLPKYRWAAPIQHALLNGEKITGLTVQQMSLGMDEGDILIQETWKISKDDTTGTLFEKTGKRAGPLLAEAVKWLQNGTVTPQKQESAEATYTKYIKKTDGEIQPDWSLEKTYHAWQAYTPWPGLSIFFGETKVTLHRVSKSPYSSTQALKHSSTVLSFEVKNWLPALALSDGYLIIHELTPAGKKRMSGEDFVRGFMK